MAVEAFVSCGVASSGCTSSRCGRLTGAPEGCGRGDRRHRSKSRRATGRCRAVYAGGGTVSREEKGATCGLARNKETVGTEWCTGQFSRATQNSVTGLVLLVLLLLVLCWSPGIKAFFSCVIHALCMKKKKIRTRPVSARIAIVDDMLPCRRPRAPRLFLSSSSSLSSLSLSSLSSSPSFLSSSLSLTSSFSLPLSLPTRSPPPAWRYHAPFAAHPESPCVCPPPSVACQPVGASVFAPVAVVVDRRRAVR